jgi:NADH-quinone oxidoreductase subunit K
MDVIRNMDLSAMSLALAAILFTIGTVGVVVRRNAIILFMCIVAFSRSAGIDGQIFVFFVMTVAAAEAAVGLALVIAIFRHIESVDMKNFNLLRW